MERGECLQLVKEHCSNRNLLKHMLATEAVMRALARELDEDEEAWATAGLVHDLDYDETAELPERHGLVSAGMLEERGFPEDIIHAVKAHNEHAPRESAMDRALYASDPVTGLIVAAALMHPTKSLGGLDVDFVMRRFGEKRFAAGASREQIATCSELGLDLERFIGVALGAMQEISDELGL
ncbi:MAG: HDIG domain-containing protein [Candidatus Eisenbacteria bacterium]|nr:HDIG domain-containing protein [Candidatus Eisenbacteria bacterium]